MFIIDVARRARRTERVVVLGVERRALRTSLRHHAEVMNPNRYSELDLVRTVAVVCMIVYHLAWDLAGFYGWDIDLGSLPWTLLQRATASVFLGLVGVGFAISWDRMLRHGGRVTYGKYVRRGMGLIGLGMAVTVVTWMVDPGTYVRFGILHCIGVAILVMPMVARFGMGNSVLGLMIIVMGLGLETRALRVSTEWLVPFGVTPPWFASVDYFPLVPWFGVVLMGYAMGKCLYVDHIGWRETRAPHVSTRNWMTWMGRNALLMYIVHQPVIIAVLWLLLGPPAF